MKECLLFLLLFAAGGSPLFAQSSPPPPATAKNWGVIREGKFVSEELGLSLEVPASFNVVSQAEADVLADAGADLLKQGTASEKRIDEAVGRSKRLLVIAEKPLGSEENSALEIVAVKQPAGITAQMALASSMMVLKGTPYSLKRSLGAIKIGANTFAAAEFEGTFGNIRLTQRMYMLMQKGYSVLFAATYLTDPQRAALEKVLSTLSRTK